jgi:putative redox protein
MSEQILRWNGSDLQFQGFTSYGDPVAIGGDAQGAGAKPSDLLPLSLAACTAYDVVVILRKQRQDLRGLEVQLRSEQDREAPWAFRSIHQHLVLTGSIDEAKASRAIELSEGRYCSVAATLRESVILTHSHEIVPA